MNTSNNGRAKIVGYTQDGRAVYEINPQQLAGLHQPAAEEEENDGPISLGLIFDDFARLAEGLDLFLEQSHAGLQELSSEFTEGDESGRYAATRREELLREMVLASEALISLHALVAISKGLLS